MLVKVRNNEKENLVILNENTFEEFLEKTKESLEIQTNFNVEYSGCTINSSLFSELLKSFGKNKELITFNISAAEEAAEIHQEIEEEVLPLQNGGRQIEAPNEPTISRSKEKVVNPKIALMKFGELFEVSKLIGAISTGHQLVKKERVSASTAVIRKVLSELGFDYM